MSQLIEVHTPGEIIWTMDSHGKVRAFLLEDDGNVSTLDTSRALKIERDR